jgi:hypothetical protein
MPYRSGERLPAQKASKIGHLDIIKNPLVKSLNESFKDVSIDSFKSKAKWIPLEQADESLPLIFGIDGSCQIIENENPPYNARAFIKTALLRIDQYALNKIDNDSPHPLALRDILEDSAIYHATIFPLRHVIKTGKSVYDAIRETIFISLKDDVVLEGQPYETFKWLIYGKWHESYNRDLPEFECPICGENTTLPFDSDDGKCTQCKGYLYVTDMLGFHQEMTEDAASNVIATTYMNIHETLLLFTGIRYFWENNRNFLSKILFAKDGPLSMRAQYSKIVEPIRRFLFYARDNEIEIHIIGQEKSGKFLDHLQLIGCHAPNGSVFIPDDKYIKEQIQNRPDRYAPYGFDTNYGAKIFVKLTDYHQMILNIPIGLFKKDPCISDLIGFNKIMATLPIILSNRFEGALLPIELAHGVASLSTYPSAKILKIFSEAKK